MKEIIKALLTGKKAAVLGMGREGWSSYKLIREVLPGYEIYLLDEMEPARFPAGLEQDKAARLHFGSGYLADIQSFDVVFKSPGIPSRVFPEGFDFSKLTSQTDLFLQKYGSQVIGVTGTKGKSTTTSLIFSILSSAGKTAHIAGNIGIPPFTVAGEIRGGDFIVMELSSHQLEFVRHSPHIGIILNLFQEHLDHYASYEAYCRAKINMGLFQEPGDYLIYNLDNALLSSMIQDVRERIPHAISYSLKDTYQAAITRIEAGIWFKDREIGDISSGMKLIGEHNTGNAMAAAAACYLAGIEPVQISGAIRDFEGLPHRLEYVGTYDGVKYYNDSIATIPEACIQAIESLKNVDTLILGGFDRGIDYSVLTAYLYRYPLQNLIFVGPAGRRMLDELNEKGKYPGKTYTAGNYNEVIRIARQRTAKGKTCLLSPAAASYDMFRNFEERGEVFKKNVRESLTL